MQPQSHTLKSFKEITKSIPVSTHHMRSLPLDVNCEAVQALRGFSGNKRRYGLIIVTNDQMRHVLCVYKSGQLYWTTLPFYIVQFREGCLKLLNIVADMIPEFWGWTEYNTYKYYRLQI